MFYVSKYLSVHLHCIQGPNSFGSNSSLNLPDIHNFRFKDTVLKYSIIFLIVTYICTDLTLRMSYVLLLQTERSECQQCHAWVQIYDAQHDHHEYQSKVEYIRDIHHRRLWTKQKTVVKKSGSGPVGNTFTSGNSPCPDDYCLWGLLHISP